MLGVIYKYSAQKVKELFVKIGVGEDEVLPKELKSVTMVIDKIDLVLTHMQVLHSLDIFSRGL